MPQWYSNLLKKIYINIGINQIIRFRKIFNSNFNFHKQTFIFLPNLFYTNNYLYNFVKYYFKLLLKYSWQQRGLAG